MSPPVSLRPEFVELEDFRRSVNRKIWFAVGGLVFVALAALGVAVVALARPIPVVVFDANWQPVLFEDTVRPRVEMANERVDTFTRHFLEKFSLVDSMDVEEDLSEATAMMTPRLRKIFLADEEEIARRRKTEDLNLKGRFEGLQIRLGDFDPGDVDARIYAVAWGAVVVTPKIHNSWAEGEAPEHRQYYYAQIVLQRVPVSRASIHGLQVHHVKTWWFDSAEDLEVHRLQESEG
ncbi:MAG: hypothetical protein RMA76_09250 [Deltaproteobacteria bacterium]